MKRPVRFTLALLLMTLSATKLSAKVIATCGGSYGHSYYLGENSWIQDKISQGSFSFVVDGKYNPNVLFKDAYGKVIDAAADGAKISFTFADSERSEFGILVVYEDTGVVETYNLVYAASGGRRVLWTSNKSNASLFPRVSAFSAECR